MKTKIFCIVFLMLSCTALKAQEFYKTWWTDSLQKEILKQIPDEAKGGMIFFDQRKNQVLPAIVNLLSREEIKDTATFGIYRIIYPSNVILLRNGNQCEVWYQFCPKDYGELLIKLIDYFNRNPEIDRRLMSTYNKIILQEFESSITGHEFGYWYKWHNDEKYKYLPKTTSESTPEETLEQPKKEDKATNKKATKQK